MFLSNFLSSNLLRVYKKSHLIVLILTVSCSSGVIENRLNKDLYYSKIKSDLKLTDRNNLGCERIDISVIFHVLETGVESTGRDIHDYYSTTGCSVAGVLEENSIHADFNFDYGGILHLSTGRILGCGKLCCQNNYIYCSWDENELRGD
ncbi:MAG TPA: hypothetical protein ENJ08_07840 [Gammaproteobacteria bacterium]|nr:hypothetical protein [Gammaproteobacteria bacterium]